ncbi:MAG TPA: UbiH/UbiF/VisC/COQ6 family ubiquinone biosynthesis hydroxylase [Gammaproteobacteria bacterium]|nr:UbiH/UbiF/VisC/COQ6 family ubiquinone biosynthesis hydroxylase [Gammaproteobacteria bacterium]
MSMQRFDIVVAGGGMVGAACALALAREGFSVALVERHAPRPLQPGDPPELRVVALSLASERLLRRLGAWEYMESVRTSPYTDMHVWDADFEGVHFDAAEIGESFLGHIVENRLVQHALWQRFQEADNATCLCPAAIAQATPQDDGIDIELEDGRRLRAALLVAADGAASPLREAFGIPVERGDYGQRGIVGVIRTQKPHQATAWQHFLPTGPLAFLPLADGSISIVWSAESSEAARLLALPDDEFRAELGKASDHVLGEVTECGPRASFPLRRQHAKTYVHERAVLIGDAAHVIHPLAGQGANLGFMDVATLVEVLVDARQSGRDFAQARVLRRYERRRRGDNATVMWAMEGFHRLFSNEDRTLGWLRNAGFRVFDRSGGLKRYIVRQAMGLRDDLPALVR